MSDQPVVVVLGGINGAGKTTSSRKLLAGQLTTMPFVNADTIASGLNALAPDSVALEAGKIMLTFLRKLAADRSSFAFETTLAGRAHLAFLRSLRSAGYRTKLYYFWLPSADMAISRVRQRVASGGHYIPEDVIRMRYIRSIDNFWTGYRALFDQWKVYDNSGPRPRKVAEGRCDNDPMIWLKEPWATFLEQIKHDP